jgi:hypothetical protein
MGYICLTRTIGNEMSTGLRLTGMETMGAESFARLDSDYYKFGRSSEQLNTFWRTFAELCLEAKPSSLHQKEALTQFLKGEIVARPPPPVAAELPPPEAAQLPPAAGQALPLPVDPPRPPMATVAAELPPPEATAKVPQPQKHTAAKSVCAPKVDARLLQPGVCDDDIE